MPNNPTEFQSEASRLNGQNSHGPTTPEGKANSSKNSLKHGLYSKSVLIAGESQEEYDQHCAEISGDYDCRTGHEKIRLKSLCNLEWKLKRCDRMEGDLAPGDSYVKDVALITTIRARLERMIQMAINTLLSMLKDRDFEERKQLADAAIIRRADKKLGRETDLKILGFVFTLPQIDKWIYLQDVLRVSRDTVLGKYAGSRA